ncbi:LysR family transcriptional regulator [Pseudoclavibacter endophyticus]|uniref:LysR family transcriptional regulator n=2 Tax=Pseudoclavibacter endophyticus TaxID=1778590 RepID=A0A6H9WVM9_9MICO|nr:LysR family transcriptional regulator [Pseudoclavibacter endophyticus]
MERGRQRDGVEFSLRQLSHFVAVAEEGAINAAAERLFMSPSAVAASITELERILGTDLCIRRRAQGVLLTPSGRLVLTRARALLGEAAELRYFVEGGVEAIVGPLEIGCYLTLAPTLLPGLLHEYEALHPGVTVNFVESAQDSLTASLRDGEVDVAILYDLGGLDEFERITLFRSRGYAFFAEDHPFASRDTVKLADLAREPLVLFDRPPSVDYVMAAFGAHGLVPTFRHRTSSYETTRALVARGTTYGILVQRPHNKRSYEGLPVVEKEVDPPMPVVPVVLAWSREHRLSPRAAAFVDLALSQHGQASHPPAPQGGTYVDPSRAV